MIDEFVRADGEIGPDEAGWVESVEIVIGCATTHASAQGQAGGPGTEGESLGIEVAGNSART